MTRSFETTRRDIEDGRTTVEETTHECLRTIERGRRLNAFLSVFYEQALERARDIDRKVAAGSAGPLAGMVVAVKDSICVRETRCTCASRILENYFPPYHATTVARLLQHDAVIIGKTNLDEFAMGSSSENSAFGPVVNPVDESRVPGGSSGGSSVAVAAGMAHAALGSDTGGSIRQPAAFCGVVGLKPTYGRVSRYGLVALASSFDQIGPFASTVADAARVLGSIAGPDPRDSTVADRPVPDYVGGLTGDVRGLKIGLPEEAFAQGLKDEIREAVDRAANRFRAAGASITEITMPHSAYTVSAYYVLMTAEASSNLARYDGVRYGTRAGGARSLREMYERTRSTGFGPEVKRRIMLGTYALSAGYYDAYYRKAQKVRRLIQNDFLTAFRGVDLLLLPTTPTTAFRLGEKTDDPLQMYLSDVYTVSANLAGVPAISVPGGVDSGGLPIGVQLIGRFFEESTLLRAADFLERS